MSNKTAAVVGVTMDELPDLSKLSHAKKDALIRELWPLRSLVTELLSWGAATNGHNM